MTKQAETPTAEAQARQLAKEIIDAIPGAIGMTPDPWPEQPDPHDGEPHRTVERLVLAAWRSSGPPVQAPSWQVDIAAERARQVRKGWTPEHDDDHTDGALAQAAACLAVEGTDAEFTTPDYDISWIKSLRDRHANSSRETQLIVAAALIVAELERIRRSNFNRPLKF